MIRTLFREALSQIGDFFVEVGKRRLRGIVTVVDGAEASRYNAEDRELKTLSCFFAQ